MSNRHEVGTPAGEVPAAGHREVGGRPDWCPAGVCGLILAVYYAVFVRFYQAAGGRFAIVGDRPAPAAAYMASYNAGVLILLGGADCIVLTHAWARTFPRWLPVVGGTEAPRPLVYIAAWLPCLWGGITGLWHGVGGIAAAGLELLGLIEVVRPIQPDLTRPEIVADDWWLIGFYQPWFVAMGVCLLLCCRRYARDSGVGAGRLRMGTIIVVIVSAVLTVAVVISVALGTVIGTQGVSEWLKRLFGR